MAAVEDANNDENNTLVAYADPSFQIAEGEYVHVSGTVKGNYSGKNALGAVFVATLYDYNNTEKAGGDSIKEIGKAIIDSGTAGPTPKPNSSLHAVHTGVTSSMR